MNEGDFDSPQLYVQIWALYKYYYYYYFCNFAVFCFHLTSFLSFQMEYLDNYSGDIDELSMPDKFIFEVKWFCI